MHEFSKLMDELIPDYTGRGLSWRGRSAWINESFDQYSVWSSNYHVDVGLDKERTRIRRTQSVETRTRTCVSVVLIKDDLETIRSFCGPLDCVTRDFWELDWYLDHHSWELIYEWLLRISFWFEWHEFLEKRIDRITGSRHVILICVSKS